MGLLCRQIRWPFVFVVAVVILVTAQTSDEEPCPDHWLFHHPSHSCFFKSNVTHDVTKATTHCSSFSGGEYKDQPGYLARILDHRMNVFLQRNTDPSQTYWIGLNDKNQTGEYRWQGLLSYEPDYFDWVDGQQPEEEANINNVVLRNSAWTKADGRTSNYYICQLEAATKNPVTMDTPLSLQSGKRATKIKCLFTQPSWTELQWVNQNAPIVASCEYREDGRHKCISNVDGYSAMITEGAKGTKVSRLGIEAVRRQDAGDLQCRVFFNQENIGERKVRLHVHESAEDVRCESSLRLDSVEFVCSTHNIYPKLSCVWKIKDVELVPGQSNPQTSMDQSYMSEDYVHYASNCSLLLEKGSFPFQTGQLNVTVTMYPTVRVDKTSIMPRYYGVSRELAIQIEKPRVPKFKHTDGRKIQSVANFVVGEEIKVTCYIYHGKPNVESTTLECEFPITRYDAYNETWVGISTVLHKNATLFMNGKMCHCYGNHLTGRTETRTLQLSVSTPESTTDVYSSTTERKAAGNNSNNATTEAYLVSTATEKNDVTTQRNDMTKEKIDVTSGSNPTPKDGNTTDRGCDTRVEGCSGTTTQRNDMTKEKIDVTSTSNPTPNDGNTTDRGCDTRVEGCSGTTLEPGAVGNDALSLKESASGSFMWIGVGAAIAVVVCVQVVVVMIVVREMRSRVLTP